MLLGVVASIGITNEFSHNTIRPTFAAMPDRWRPLLAKPIVQVVHRRSSLTVAIVVVSWLRRWGHRRATRRRSTTGPVPALVGVVLLAVGLTLLGYGLGLLVRNSAATICILLLWPLIAEGLIAGLLSVAGAEGAVQAACRTRPGSTWPSSTRIRTRSAASAAGCTSSPGSSPSSCSDCSRTRRRDA